MIHKGKELVVNFTNILRAAFVLIFLCAKNYKAKLTVSREKLRKTLKYEIGKFKMLVKLTLGL